MSRKRRSGFKPRQAMKSGNTFAVWGILLGGRVTQVAGFLNRMAGSAGMVWYATLPDPQPNLADGSFLGGYMVKGRNPKSGELEGCQFHINEEWVVKHARKKKNIDEYATTLR